MFSRQIVERPNRKSKIENPVLSEAKDHKSEIAIRIWGSDTLPKLERTFAQQLWTRLVKPLYTPPSEPFPDRYATLKCQMQFGWDFAPRLRTCGIWDDVSVAIARSVFIEDAWVKAQIPNPKSQNARVQVVLTLDSDREHRVRVVCIVRGKNFQSNAQSFKFDLNLARGTQAREIAFDLQDARLWNPWDRGEPNLYELEISILSGAQAESQDVALDSCIETFGIRDFSLTRPPHTPVTQEPWQFVVNGAREFVRGANWVPLDAIPARLTRTDYAARLQQARDANINFLRVWGGGLREKRAFYDLCDEMGLLVWQEFPFAGTLLDHFPRDRAFLNFICDECSDIVRAVRNHPSLVVWCGGNEFSPRGNQPIVKKLRAVVKDKDGTRPFKPASPYRDESHHWRVWHRYANLRDYRDDPTPFLSEFGLQALPNFESLKKFLPADALAAPHTLWEYHRAELRKLGRYARSVILSEAKKLTNRDWESASRTPLAMTTEAFVDASQRAQAIGLQIAIEHIRRHKPQASGVLASFDYEWRPRRAGNVVRGDVWIINDLRAAYSNAELRAYLNDQEIFERAINIEPDSATRVDALAMTLGDGENILRFQVTWQDNVLSDHEYDLNFCDVGEISLLSALMAAIGKQLMR
jgi:beta-mannosidase